MSLLCCKIKCIRNYIQIYYCWTVIGHSCIKKVSLTESVIVVYWHSNKYNDTKWSCP